MGGMNPCYICVSGYLNAVMQQSPRSLHGSSDPPSRARPQVMPSNFQMRGMHTILRDRETSNSDFVFYADRINRLLVEAGLGHLPFREKIITTPTGGWINAARARATPPALMLCAAAWPVCAQSRPFRCRVGSTSHAANQ
jgi:hypothetical protein